MIDLDTSLEKYRYVREYEDNVSVTPEDFQQILFKAWQVTPSKNNFMPYNVHVIGPDKQNLKELVYKKCVGNEGTVDSVSDVEKVRYSKIKPRYWNIVSADYVLLFTLRIETEPSEFQKDAMNRGITFEAMDQKNTTAAAHNAKIEIGMFSTALSSLCLKNNLDISHILCFPTNLERWNEEEFSFIDRQVLMIMTVGKGKHYRRDIIPLDKDQKPNFDRIVKMVKK